MDVKAILLKRVDVRGLIVEDVLQGMVKAAIQKFVADTSFPYDDTLYNIIYPMIEKEVTTRLDEYLASLSA